MRLLFQTKFQVLILFIASAVLCVTGCKSQRGFPAFGDLAWWRKDDVRLAETLPPAAHFDPEPAIQAQIASVEDPKDDVAAAVAEAIDQAANKNRYSHSKQPPTHPMRTPYSFDSARQAKSAVESESASVATPSDDNSFASTAGQIKTKLPDWDAAEDAVEATSLNKVQQSLQDSLEITKSNLEVAKANTAEGVKKTFDSTIGSTDSSDNAWRTDFALPANETGGLNASIEAARKSLNRAEEQASNEFEGFKHSLQTSTDRAIKPLARLAEKAAEVTEPAAQSTTFDPNPFYQPIKPPQTEIQKTPVVKSEMKLPSEINSQSELDRIQNAAIRLQENANQFQQLAEQARLQAAALRRQADLSSTPTVSENSEQMTMQNQTDLPRTAYSGFQPRVAQLTGDPQLPTNSLRNSRPHAQPSNLAPITPANPIESNGQNSYPSTPHNDYAPKGSVSQQDQSNAAVDGSQVSFDRTPNAPTGVVTAGGGSQLSPIPARTDSSQVHSSGDVIVPNEIMFGSGSFAPGSVNQLIPAGK